MEIPMGLDQYAYCRATKTISDDEDREIAYWRKHPNLQGWMERLWVEKGRPVDTVEPSLEVPYFNGIELELTWEDIDRLEHDIQSGELPNTSGFFFGDNSDTYYLNKDLEFVQKARAELFVGLRVFYNSSW
jgi:hypothetical protein